MSISRKIGVVVAGHGSQNPVAILEFQEQMRLFSALQEGIVEHGFLEFETPGIGEAIDRAITCGANMLVVLPAMLTSAHHVKIDIPNIIRIAKQKHPLISIRYGRHLDLHPKIIELSKNRIQQSLSECSFLSPRQSTLMVVGRGTSDSSGNGDVITLTRLLGEAFGFGEARYAYTSVAKPLFKDALEDVRQTTLLILPYLLFSGMLVHKIGEYTHQFQKENGDIFVKLAQSLGPDILVANALQDRYFEAIRRI